MDARTPRFRIPPGWPEPPDGWVPPSGWTPPSHWSPVPEGWCFWEQSDTQTDPPAETPASRSVHIKKAAISRYQRRWLALFWLTTGLNLLFLLLALTGKGVPLEAILAVSSGALGVLLGSLLVTLATRNGIDDVDFDDLAKGMRVAVVAWLFLGCAIVVGTIVGSGFGDRPTAGPRAIEVVVDFSESVAAQIFGLAILFTVVGDGYTKYRQFIRRRGAPTSG